MRLPNYYSDSKRSSWCYRLVTC